MCRPWSFCASSWSRNITIRTHRWAELPDAMHCIMHSRNAACATVNIIHLLRTVTYIPTPYIYTEYVLTILRTSHGARDKSFWGTAPARSAVEASHVNNRLFVPCSAQHGGQVGLRSQDFQDQELCIWTKLQTCINTP